MPHTSIRRFRKCGEKPRSADQTPVLDFRDLRFCCRKSVCARRFPIFSRTSENGDKNPLSQSENATNTLWKQSLKRKNRLSAVPTDQAGRTVARPHQRWTIRKAQPRSILNRENRSELRPSNHASAELHASRKTPAISPFLN